MKKLLRSNAGAVLAAGLLMGLGSLGLTGCQTYQDQVRFSPVEGEEAGTGTSVTGAPVTGTSVTGEAARLALGDPVRIIFSGITDPPPVHEEQIKDDGNLTLPNIGVIKAEGKTTGELQKEIHDKYVPAFYKRITVTVATDRRIYYVGGQVRSPNRQEYLGPTTVTKAIQAAGDFTDFANRRKVVLTRADGKQEKVDCIKAAKDPTYDRPVFPGDKIEVPMRGFDFR